MSTLQINSQLGLAVCVALAVGTIVAKESLWHLGGIYWFVLSLLALTHVVCTGAVIFANPNASLIKFGVVVLLIVGQWWAIQMIAMQVIWRLRGFAP